MTTLAAASSNSVAPGTIGFLVVFGMAVLLFFLFRSMSKHLRKVNAAALRDQTTDAPDARRGDSDAAATSSGAASARDPRRDA